MANIVTLPGPNVTPFPQQSTAPPGVKRVPVAQTPNRFSNREAGKLKLVAVAPPTGLLLLQRKFRGWISGLVFLTLSVAGHCADIQISNPVRESGFALVVEGDGIVFRSGTDRVPRALRVKCVLVCFVRLRAELPKPEPSHAERSGGEGSGTSPCLSCSR